MEDVSAARHDRQSSRRPATKPTSLAVRGLVVFAAALIVVIILVEVDRSGW